MIQFQNGESNDMNIKDIKALVKILESSNLTSIEVGDGDNRICLRREGAVAPVPAPAVYARAAEPVYRPVEATDEPDRAGNFQNAGEITSPLVGVYYASPAPDAKAFVAPGSKVKKGDVLCIIEAMKLMNEITADRDGEIVDVCAENGQIVEYGQTLFRII